MLSSTPISKRFKLACSLTGADWCILVKNFPDGWNFLEKFHFPKIYKKILNKTLFENNLFQQTDDALHQQQKKYSLLTNPENFSCKRVYAFPIPTDKYLIVGGNMIFNNTELGIWKLVSTYYEQANQNTTETEVDLLQNAVLELQLTQQELQARISAQREAEGRMIQTAKLAAVGEMAAGVAHELNNPLTSVVGFTELALEELPADASVRKELTLVLKEARRARTVVRSLLDFARQTEHVYAKADINEIVTDVLTLTSHFIQTNHIQLENHLGENLHWVLVDTNQFKQVVINLLNNAINAMPEGGKITIETSEKPRFTKNWSVLSIKDNGIGISSENLGRIFEPFFTTRANRGGTGLGLSVTYGIITDHGGMIEVESQENIGSTFVVWLPLEEAA